MANYMSKRKASKLLLLLKEKRTKWNSLVIETCRKGNACAVPQLSVFLLWFVGFWCIFLGLDLEVCYPPQAGGWWIWIIPSLDRNIERESWERALVNISTSWRVETIWKKLHSATEKFLTNNVTIDIQVLSALMMNRIGS